MNSENCVLDVNICKCDEVNSIDDLCDTCKVEYENYVEVNGPYCEYCSDSGCYECGLDLSQFE